MLTPLDRIQRHALLHQFPQRTQFAQETDAIRDRLQDIIDFLFRGEAADAEADTAMGALVAIAQRAQDVARLERGRGACAARGEGDVFEGHEERFAFDVVERYVHTTRVEVLWVAVLRGVFEGEEAAEKSIGEGEDALGVVLFGGRE